MPRRHTVLALVVAVCWAVNFVVIDIGLESFPPLLFVALRFGLIAFPAIFFVARPDVRWPAVVAVGLFICVGQFGLLFVAMDTGLPAGLASVIAPLQPVFTIPLAAVALGERPRVHQVAGVSLAVAGIGAIAAGRAHGVPLRAVAIGIASAASWGCGNVVTRAAGTKRPFSLLVWSSAVAPVPLLGLSLIFEGSARWQSAASSINASGIAALGYVVIVSTFFGYGVWYRLMSRHPASTVAPFTLLVPAVGIFTAWLVRGEHPTSGELIGAAIVVVGLALALGLGDTFTLQRATREDSMAGLEHRDFSAPDETRTPDKTTVDLVNVGGGQIGRFTFQPGWRWSECIKPVAGTDSCQVEHIGYAVSGSLHVKHDDGTEGDVVAGQVYRIAAGHDAWNTGNEPAVFVEFQGAANYAKGQ